MKRDMDIVRDLLLKIEETDQPSDGALLEKAMPDVDGLILQYHLKMMKEEAGLIVGNSYQTLSDGTFWASISLTWSGHEYLDNIRDPEIWKQTKIGAKKIGGFSLELMGALAKGLVVEKIKKHTGTDVKF